jgi:cytochrome P450
VGTMSFGVPSRRIYRDGMPADEYRFPPQPRIPGAVATAIFGIGGAKGLPWLHRRYGSAFMMNTPFGRSIVISDPAHVKQVFTAPADVLYGGEDSPLARTIGPNSSFALDEDDHLRQRRLLLPPFHGARMAGYAQIFEEEAVREMATWPDGRDFPTIKPMMRITINAILRTVFGAEGHDLDQLRRILPGWTKLGSWLTSAPWMHHDLGPWSPWGRFIRTRRIYDALIDRLIETGRQDPALGGRSDVLAMLLQARYDDGSEMTRDQLADQLLSLLVAGHETTAGTLAWAVDRIRRHPVLLQRLVDEVETGGGTLREATMREVQRTRPVINGTMRKIKQPFELGEWRLPPGVSIFVDATAMHYDPQVFPDPHRFEPDRFIGRKPATYEWVPFGGGRRRCVGAAFAQMEMDVVLRVMLERFELTPTTERPEKWLFRGVAFAPHRGGIAHLRRRPTPLTPAQPLSAAEPAVV